MTDFDEENEPRYHRCAGCGAKDDCADDCPALLAERLSCSHEFAFYGRCKRCGARKDDPTGETEAAEAKTARAARRVTALRLRVTHRADADPVAVAAALADLVRALNAYHIAAGGSGLVIEHD